MVFTTQFVGVLIAFFLGGCIGAKISRCDKLTEKIEDLQQRILQIKNAANVEHVTRLIEKEELMQHLMLATNSIQPGTAIHEHCMAVLNKYGGTKINEKSIKSNC